MTTILKASASGGTHTIQRRWGKTETPKQGVVAERSVRLESSEWNMWAAPRAVVRLVSGAEECSTASSGVEAFLVSTPQDADAIFETPGADLAALLGRALPAVSPVTHGEDSAYAKIMERLLTRHTVMVTARVPSSTSTQVRRRYDQFRSKLMAALLDEPIEDGVTHPAERVIDEALRAHAFECRDGLSRMLVEQYQTRPSVGALIVRCVGRLDYDRVGTWGMRVADDALQHRDVEVREAAVRALEAWGGCEALSMLRSHSDSVAWLSDYINQVIIDLSGTTS